MPGASVIGAGGGAGGVAGATRGGATRSFHVVTSKVRDVSRPPPLANGRNVVEIAASTGCSCSGGFSVCHDDAAGRGMVAVLSRNDSVAAMPRIADVSGTATVNARRQRSESLGERFSNTKAPLSLCCLARPGKCGQCLKLWCCRG